MKKLLVVAFLGLLAFGCNKDQKAVNQLEGEWKAQFFYTILDGTKSNNQVDPATGESAKMTFTACKLKKEDFCPMTYVYTNADGSVSVAYEFRVSGDDSVIELREPGKTFIHELQIVERTKVNLKLLWKKTDDLTLDIQLKKQ